jgi:hypothetical protein
MYLFRKPLATTSNNPSHWCYPPPAETINARNCERSESDAKTYDYCNCSLASGGRMSHHPAASRRYFDGSDLKDVTLNQYRGKKNVVLAFYVFAFTGG